jgi:predicted ATPase/Tfp pilus assembly protein PilF
VELAGLTDAGLVGAAVAGALGVREQAGRETRETLAEAVKARRVLVLLDNCEHVVAAAAEAAELLLKAGAGVRVLATSREVLGVPGEAIRPVPPLPLPAPDAERAEEILGSAAVRLFVERARLARAGFELDEANAAAAAALCRRLEGIPLAVELAAARMRVLTLDEILLRTENRLRLLVGTQRRAPERQQTLRAAIDWSHELLEEEERALFRRLSVFAGGWTLEAAEAAAGNDEGDGPDRGESPATPARLLRRSEALQHLTRLVDKSLVIAEEREGAARYRMLETIREFAREKLVEAGEESETRARHEAWCLRLAERAETASRGPEQQRWYACLEAEHDNLRAALGRAEPDVALRLCGALGRFWEAHSHLSEGRAWTEAALGAGADRPPALRAKACHAVGILALRQGSYEQAREHFESEIELWRQVGNDRARAEALRLLGYVEQFRGAYERAERLYEESLEYFRAADDLYGVAGAVGDLGILAMDRGDHARAIACFEESLAIDRSLGNSWAAATMLHNLGEAVQRAGDCERAAALVEESLVLSREIGNRHLTAYSLHVLANIANDVGDYTRAVASLRKALELDRELGDRGGLAYVFEGFACTAVALGDPERAMRLMGVAAALREDLEMVRSPAESAALEAYTVRARAALGEAAAERALAEGRALGVEQAVAEALGTGRMKALRDSGTS